MHMHARTIILGQTAVLEAISGPCRVTDILIEFLRRSSLDPPSQSRNMYYTRTGCVILGSSGRWAAQLSRMNPLFI